MNLEAAYLYTIGCGGSCKTMMPLFTDVRNPAMPKK